MKRNQEKSNIDVASEVDGLLQDKKVQEDRVVRLGMLSILGLYLQGVQKEDITRIEVMNAVFFKNILENYRPELVQRLNCNDFCLMAEEFCDGLKSIVKAALLSCFRAKNENSITLDNGLVDKLKESLMEKTIV